MRTGRVARALRTASVLAVLYAVLVFTITLSSWSPGGATRRGHRVAIPRTLLWGSLELSFNSTDVEWGPGMGV